MDTRTAGECFLIFFTFSQTSMIVSITRQNTKKIVSISFRKQYTREKKRKSPVYFDYRKLALPLRQQLEFSSVFFYRVLARPTDPLTDRQHREFIYI